MISALKNLILPDYCCSCGDIGAIICENCKYDIVSDIPQLCVACRVPQSRDGVCGSCALPYTHSWYVGDHRGALESLVAVSKFNANRSGCDAQAGLINHILPSLPTGTVIVPVPTIAKHIRQRGYGHAERIARQLARLRGVQSRRVVGRNAQFVQHGANRTTRQKQAKSSYILTEKLEPNVTYVIVDDVFTTGFTTQYVAQTLRDGGASDVWVAVTSRQPIDEK